MKSLTLRRWKAIDHTAVEQDLEQSITSKTLASPILHQLYDKLLSNILNTHAPEKTVTITVRPNCAWMNENILQEKRERRKLESRWRRTHLAVHRQMYTDQRDKVNRLIQAAKISYYEQKISNCQNDQKALFKIVQGLLTKPASATSASDVSPDDINNFFLNKIDKIYSAFQTQSTAIEQVYHSVCSIEKFASVSQDEVQKIINKSPTKSSSLDPWPTWMTKMHLKTLLPCLTAVVNRSLDLATFPSEWKHALITPLLKKPSADPLVLSNYRPVSNLPFLSKVVERIVSKQLTTYLQENNLYPVFQSAYRQCHSVETALLRVQNDILQAIDEQQGVILVLLDLSAAFDTICHDILLHRLKHRFGISGDALKWISSYLHQRSQSVLRNGQISASLPIPHGVPQGSVLGPILFSLYTSPICEIVNEHNIQFHLYADDTQIYMRFSFRTNPSIHSAMNSVQQCIADINAWMDGNKLKLNGDKTELILLTSPRVRSKVDLSSINIRDCNIPASPVIRNLGSWFDQSLTMEEHVKVICKTCYFHLHNIAAIRDMLTREATEKLMHAFITSRLDNCNSLLINVPASIIQKLQRVQNTAARIVMRKNKRDSISAILKQLHWLPVKERITFKVLCITYKCMSGRAPLYLSELLKSYTPPRGLRSQNQHYLCQPSSRTKSYGDRSFAVTAPRWWNELPLVLRHCDNYDSFKRHLKTYLFSKAF